MNCGDCERYKAMYDEDADYVATWHAHKEASRNPAKRRRNPKPVYCPHDTSHVVRVITAATDSCSAYRDRTYVRTCLHIGCDRRFSTKQPGVWFCQNHRQRAKDPNDQIRGALRT